MLGNCQICGSFETLTKEHVPPQKAFNSRNFIIASRESAEHLRYDEFPKGKINQGGITFNSLCKRCNNDTGAHYAREYVEFAHLMMDFGMKTNFNPPYFSVKCYPLRLIKQVVTMFFSINEDLRITNPELSKFVLNRNEKYLPNNIRIYGYFNFEGNLRYSKMSFGGQNDSVFSEMTFSPFGFVMSFDSLPPDQRMFDITFFSHSDIDEFRDIKINMPTLPTHINVPGIYLDKKQIEENYKLNGM